MDWEKSGPGVSRPNAFQRKFFRKLEHFDRAYFLRQVKEEINAQRWDHLANQVFGEYGNMPPEGENGPFILRGKLIQGECLLFAAVDHMKNNRREEALNSYRRGLRLLQKVILLENVFRNVNNTELGELPQYRKQEVYRPYGENTVIHPYAGYETIGTGLLERPGQEGQEGQAVKGAVYGRGYRPIQQLQKKLQKNLLAVQSFQNMRSAPSHLGAFNHLIGYGQKSTESTARDLLSDFCPWGVEMFYFMEQAGLIKDLDFRILRPFAGSLPTMGERFVAGLKQIPDLIMSNPVDPRDEIPPVISEMVLRTPRVPKHIHDEMRRIIGDGNIGYLDASKKRPVKWAWVKDEPIYNVWYLSPAVFDWQPSDYLWLWFTAVKLYFSPAGTAVDSVVSGLLSSIGSIYGRESDIYFTAKVAVEANDKGFVTTDSVEKGKWLSSASATRKIAGYAFNAAEEQMKKDLYEGIDPKKFSLGRTYDGGPIPPVIIRAEVYGYEQVPDDEYPRAVQAVRFYLLYPENIAHKEPYQDFDLSVGSLGEMTGLFRREAYLTEQGRFRPGSTADEPVRRLAWKKLPDPLQSFEVLTDFSPRKQLLVFRLTEESSIIVSKVDNIRAELWKNDDEGARCCARTVIEQGQQSFRFELYNKNDPSAKAEFERRRPLVVGMTGGTPPDAEQMVQLGRSIREQAAVQRRGDPSIGLVDMKSLYQLRLVADGKTVSRRYRVVLNRGRKSQREITGSVSQLEPGVLALEYSPELEILELKVRKGNKVRPGRRPGNTNSGRSM